MLTDLSSEHQPVVLWRDQQSDIGTNHSTKHALLCGAAAAITHLSHECHGSATVFHSVPAVSLNWLCSAKCSVCRAAQYLAHIAYPVVDQNMYQACMTVFAECRAAVLIGLFPACNRN